jgi:hypothetical protein
MQIGSVIDAPPGDQPLLDEEALFREARRLRRQRWAARVLVAIVLLGVVVAIAELAMSGSGVPASTRGDVAAGALPSGGFATLSLAGPLAVGPTGVLYVADVARDRILVRLNDGRFRVVAGRGTAGFSGDGGPAVRAELSDISGLAFAPDGSLYIADGGRVRIITPAGAIHTIAGNGHGGPIPNIANGTPALSAPLGSLRARTKTGGPLAIALSPNAQLYISAGSQILRLTPAGTLDTIRATIASGPYKGRHISGFGSIAIDPHGNIDVSGVNGWSIWQITSTGVARYVGYARCCDGNYANLDRGPNGTIYAENGDEIVRVDARRLTTIFTFTARVHGEYFYPTYFALTPHRELYADELPGGGGFEAHQQLVSVRNTHTNLLWQERNASDQHSLSPH